VCLQSTAVVVGPKKKVSTRHPVELLGISFILALDEGVCFDTDASYSLLGHSSLRNGTIVQLLSVPSTSTSTSTVQARCLFTRRFI